jgi:hypothetical protein
MEGTWWKVQYHAPSQKQARSRDPQEAGLIHLPKGPPAKSFPPIFLGILVHDRVVMLAAKFARRVAGKRSTY